MCSDAGDWTCLQPGFPIRTPSDHSLVIGSPRLIADSYVLHRFLVPRHPPCALKNLQNAQRLRCSRPLCNSQTTPRTPTSSYSHTCRRNAVPTTRSTTPRRTPPTETGGNPPRGRFLMTQQRVDTCHPKPPATLHTRRPHDERGNLTGRTSSRHPRNQAP